MWTFKTKSRKIQKLMLEIQINYRTCKKRNLAKLEEKSYIISEIISYNNKLKKLLVEVFDLEKKIYNEFRDA